MIRKGLNRRRIVKERRVNFNRSVGEIQGFVRDAEDIGKSYRIGGGEFGIDRLLSSSLA